jgi:hypothetical protein
LAFPGLPTAILSSIDEQVALLDRDILDGVEPIIEGYEGDEGDEQLNDADGSRHGQRTSGVSRRGDGYDDHDDDDDDDDDDVDGIGTAEMSSVAQTTMEHSQSMDVSTSMDMTIE